MKKLSIICCLVLMIVALQSLYSQTLPNPKITSSFNPDSSCINRNTSGTGGPGKGECLYACENHLATYCTSLSATDTYSWTVVGGTIGGNSTVTGIGLNCVTVLWGPAGSGNISVIETDTSGNTGIDHACVNIINAPKAIFTPTSISACSGIPVNFTDASLNAISYIWNFGDLASGGNNTSALQNPTHLFSAPGTYTVTLVVFNHCGCSDTTHGTVTITSLSGPRIDCPSTVCAGTTKCYSTPDGCLGAVYTWTVTGGTRLAPFGSVNNICVQWGSGNPQGQITLTITGCGSVCPGPTTVDIPIVPTTTTIMGGSVACYGANSVYSVPAWPGACYNWTVPAGAATIIAGDSTNHIQVHWNTVGTFTINVSWHDDLLGCAPGSASIQVTVKPDFDIIGPTDPICLNSSATFTAIGNPFTPSPNFTWSCPGGTVTAGQGTQSATIQFTSPGLQTVTATPIGSPNPYCSPSKTFTVNVVMVNPPISITGPDTICANGTYTYSTPPPPSGLDIQWTATGGVIVGSSHANPVSVTWNPIGPYSISVSYVNTVAPFCSSTPFTLPVYLFNVPSITGSQNVCMDQTFTYTAGGSHPALDYQWSIVTAPSGPTSPDGSIVTGQGSNSVSVLWHGPGSVTVYLQLTVCSTIITLPITINPKPTPTIMMSGQLCNPVILTASAGYISYSWSNGASGNPIVVNTGGNYTVTVTNAGGCTGTATINVPTPPGPVASISTPDPTSYCPATAPISVTLYALQGAGYTYLWSNGSILNPITVTTPGTYYVTVTDANNCKSVSNSIIITRGPCPPPNPCVTTDTVGFTFGIPSCNPVPFTGVSTPGATNLIWNFGDPLSGTSDTSTSTNPTHSFTSAGYYTVTYSGTGAPNCAIAVSHPVAITIAADFSDVIGCAGSPTQFTDHSTFLPPYSITSYSWNFGDFTSSTSPNPSHVYAPGTYTVTLTITNSQCTVMKTKIITINPLPSAAFILPPISCVGTDIPMSAAASNLTYAWSFGDGATSAVQNTSHAYTTPGPYTVTLTVTDTAGGGCTNTVSQSITIVPPAGTCLISPAGIVTVCPNQLPYPLTAPPASSYQWYLNGLPVAGLPGIAPTLNVTVGGNYTVVVTDANGCKCKTPPVTVVVNPSPFANITVTPGQLVCLGSGSNAVTLSTPPGPGSYKFAWTENGSPVGSNSNTFGKTYSITGSYVYVVTVTDTVTGCVDSAKMTIKVCNTPAPPIITPFGSTNLCQGDSVTLMSSIGPPFILWSTGQTTQSITVYAAGTYIVTFKDPGCGCKSSASIVVKVFPYPDFSLFPVDDSTCCDKICDTAHICAPRGYLGYQWQLNGVNIPPPLGNSEDFTPPASGSYTLILTGPNGCKDTSKPYCVILEKCSGMCVTPPKDMVAWWPLNDPNGGTLDTEIVGNHYGVPKPGAIHDYPTWVTGYGPSPASTVTLIGGGKVGDALYFFGQNPTRGYVDVAHSSAITFATSDMSIDAWVYIQSDTTGIHPIVEKMALSPVGTPVGYRFYLNNGMLTFDVASVSPSANPSSVQFPTPLSINKWHHVAVTMKRNSSPQRIVLYEDGVPVQTTPIISIGNMYETAHLLIGGSQLAIETPLLNIAIDELELFTRALDSTEIYSLWHADSKGKCRACDEACTGVITGTKWYDLNRNGRFDQPAEKGIPNWKISLVVCNGNNMPSKDTIATTTTDSLGNYSFTNLCPGEYCVIEQHLPGWKQTWPHAGFYHVPLADSQVIGNINFGNWKPRINIWNGTGIDSVHFNPDSVYYGGGIPWPIVIAQLSPYQVVFNGMVDPTTDFNLRGAVGDYSIRRRRIANFSFSEIALNDNLLPNGSADSVTVTLTPDTTIGVTIGFFDITTPDNTVRFRTFSADQFARLDQARPVVIRRTQTTFAGNTANLVAQLFRQGGRPVVGKAGQSTPTGKVAPYLAPGTQIDVATTFYSKTFTHTAPAHGIDFDAKENLIFKLQKSLPATKQNNTLVADMLALELNILFSDKGITPPGFGDLVVLDSLITTDHRRIKPGCTVRELADSINNIMTNWRGVSADIYLNVDNILEQINNAFMKPLPLTAADTTAWLHGTNFQLAGVVPLDNVPFLLKISSAAASGNASNTPNHVPLPSAFALHQNYPNPFNPVTVLSYDLPVSSHVTLTIYNTLGQVVSTLVNNVQDAGFRSVEWNGNNIASGVYFYRIEAVGVNDPAKAFTQVKKMVLIK
ncbi:MAG: PKD domain-containing protein [Bacteroidota bacterium]